MTHRPADGLGWGLFLHRFHPMKDWPRLLESMVPAAHREGAEAYLRGIAARVRVVRNLRRQGGGQGYRYSGRREGLDT